MPSFTTALCRSSIASRKLAKSRSSRSAVQLLKKQWRERPERKVQEQELWREHGNYDVVNRTVQSNFRTWLHVTFGGRAWVHWFLMLGDLPSELIELANKHIRERVKTTEHREPSKGKHPHPKLSARNHAASRGEAAPAKSGVRRIRGKPYEARKHARLLEKQRVRVDWEWWNNGWCSMGAKEYYDLTRREEVGVVRQSRANVITPLPCRRQGDGKG